LATRIYSAASSGVHPSSPAIPVTRLQKHLIKKTTSCTFLVVDRVSAFRAFYGRARAGRLCAMHTSRATSPTDLVMLITYLRSGLRVVWREDPPLRSGPLGFPFYSTTPFGGSGFPDPEPGGLLQIWPRRISTRRYFRCWT